MMASSRLSQLLQRAARHCSAASGLSYANSTDVALADLMSYSQWPPAGQGPSCTASRSGLKAAQLAGASLLLAPLVSLADSAVEGDAQHDAGGAAAPAGNESTAKWRIYTGIARELVSQGRAAEAEQYLVAALEQAVRGFGEGEPHVASAANNLAEYYRLRGRYDEAEPLYKQALSILEASYGPADVRLAVALHNVAGMYAAMRRLDEAASHYQRSLQVKQTALGATHPEYASTLFQLAETRWAQGRQAEAVALGEEACTLLDARGEGEGRVALRRTERLAAMMAAAGRTDDAVLLLRRVLQAAQAAAAAGGGPHAVAAYAAAQERLAVALLTGGRTDEASQLLQECLNIRKEALGTEHPLVGVTLRRLADAQLRLEQEDRLERAAACASRAVDIARTVWLGAVDMEEEHAAAAAAPSWLSSLWRRGSGVVQPSVPPLLAAVEFARSLMALAEVHGAAGRADEARDSLRAAVATLQDSRLQRFLARPSTGGGAGTATAARSHASVAGGEGPRPAGALERAPESRRALLARRMWRQTLQQCSQQLLQAIGRGSHQGAAGACASLKGGTPANGHAAVIEGGMAAEVQELQALLSTLDDMYVSQGGEGGDGEGGDAP